MNISIFICIWYGESPLNRTNGSPPSIFDISISLNFKGISIICKSSVLPSCRGIVPGYVWRNALTALKIDSLAAKRPA